MVGALETVIRIPCGIADSRCEVAYVSTATGIAQLRLESGRLGWSTDEARRPVALSGSKLFAVRPTPNVMSALQLIGFDTSGTSRAVFVSEPILLPGSLASAVDLEIGVEADNGLLVVRWAASKTYGGGAPPPEHIRRRESGMFRGAVRINLEGGHVEAIAPPAAESTEPAEVGEFEMSVGSEWRTRTWRAGAERAVLVLTTLPSGKQSLSIEIARAQPLPPELIELTQGQALVVLVSLDRGHVLVRDEDGGATPSSWKVFSVRERRWVSTVAYEEGTRTAGVCGGCLVYLVKQPRPPAKAGAHGSVATVLKARDLATNAPLWSVVLREDASSPPRLRQ